METLTIYVQQLLGIEEGIMVNREKLEDVLNMALRVATLKTLAQFSWSNIDFSCRYFSPSNTFRVSTEHFSVYIDLDSPVGDTGIRVEIYKPLFNSI